MCSRMFIPVLVQVRKGGIGEALVTEYTHRGLHAIATVLPEESSAHLSEAGIAFFPLDVTDEKSVEGLKHSVQKLTGGYLHVLINCAGIAYTMTAIDTDLSAVKHTFDVNVFGPMRSIGGVIPYLYGSSYNATRAALQHRSSSLRVEMSPFMLAIDSYYSPLAEDFQQHVTGTPAGATDRFKYAVNVVERSLKPSPPAWFWYGSFTTMIRLMDTFGWRTIWDSILWKMFDLEKLKMAHANRFRREAAGESI
ncbi:hypothetical protein DL769_008624 [Monosporascus sp. CRB-8-3]|nr:hypothetical protein DL769_008624 [Monosporascus sp. CRB-8-3]